MSWEPRLAQSWLLPPLQPASSSTIQLEPSARAAGLANASAAPITTTAAESVRCEIIDPPVPAPPIGAATGIIRCSGPLHQRDGGLESTFRRKCTPTPVLRGPLFYARNVL